MQPNQLRLESFGNPHPRIDVASPIHSTVVKAVDIGLAYIAVTASEAASDVRLERMAESLQEPTRPGQGAACRAFLQ